MTDAKLPWLVAVALAAGIAPAHAGGALITPPPGWHSDPEQATALGQRFAATTSARHRDAITAAEAYVPGQPGIALFATRVTIPLAAGSATDEPGQLARQLADDLRAGPRRAALAGGNAREDAWQTRGDAAGKQLVVTLAWSEPSSHTTDRARLVIVRDDRVLVAVTGECLGLDDTPRAVADACSAALAALDPGLPVAGRVAIALPDAATPVELAEDRPPPSMTEARGGLADGLVRLPPTAIALDPVPPDRRPMYVGGGILVLAALFWWNRKHREQIERAEARAERRERRPERRRPRDEDADDLHAAAHGDAADPDDLDVNSAPRDHS